MILQVNNTSNYIRRRLSDEILEKTAARGDLDIQIWVEIYRQLEVCWPMTLDQLLFRKLGTKNE